MTFYIISTSDILDSFLMKLNILKSLRSPYDILDRFLAIASSTAFNCLSSSSRRDVVLFLSLLDMAWARAPSLDAAALVGEIGVLVGCDLVGDTTAGFPFPGIPRGTTFSGFFTDLSVDRKQFLS